MLWLARNDKAHPYDGLDRMFDEMTRGFGIEAPFVEGAYRPSLDVTETAGEWRVAAELPGVAPADVEVSVTQNVLTIRGEKKSATKNEAENVRRDERRYGKFARSFEFPGDVDGTKVAAKFANGLLLVTLPKAEDAKPKTIDVKVE